MTQSVPLYSVVFILHSNFYTKNYGLGGGWPSWMVSTGGACLGPLSVSPTWRRRARGHKRQKLNPVLIYSFF